MTLRFLYRSVRMRQPVWSLFGRITRPRPLVTITLVGPKGDYVRECLLDSGADDTVFPETAAEMAGIDLTNAPEGEFGAVGGGRATGRYAEVLLRLTDGVEFREWPARVGFIAAPMRQPLLGFAGVMQ